MMPAERLRLIHLAAEMYYLLQKTQSEIAKELGVSRPMVSRLLSQARAQGIVQITINNPFEDLGILAEELRALLGLDAVVVTHGDPGNDVQMRRRLGLAAAQFLVANLQREDRLGIGWGRTMFEVAEALEKVPEFNLTVVPLMGGLGDIAPSFQVNSLARTFSEKLGGKWHALYIPAIIEDESTYLSLLRSRDVSQINDLWDALNIAVVGIGHIKMGDEVKMLFADYLDNNNVMRLTQEKAVGDILMRFFDLDGREHESGNLTSIELERLRRIPRRVGVAGGRDKVDAIIGAARGKYINILITDESAAKSILERVNPSEMEDEVH